MLTATHPDLVLRAFEDKEPRPIRELILEVYPGATIDANGRAHAPCDGYRCPFTDKEFRAGEYLPFEDSEPREQRTLSFMDHSSGRVDQLTGTRAQLAAAAAELIRQTRELEALESTHVGEVGQMMDLPPLTVKAIKGFDTAYGMKYFHVLKDDSGNVYIYKGKLLRTGPNPHLDHPVRPQDTVILRAKIKAHTERDRVRQTVIERPKLKK